MFLYLALFDSLKTLDLISESVPEIFSMQYLIGKVEYEKSVESVKMDVVDSEVEILDDGKKDKSLTEIKVNKPIMSIKELNILINDLNILCSKNPEFVFLHEIQTTILNYNNEITKWVEKIQSLIPAKSTRSKLSKDLKTKSKKDLIEVECNTKFCSLFHT